MPEGDTFRPVRRSASVPIDKAQASMVKSLSVGPSGPASEADREQLAVLARPGPAQPPSSRQARPRQPWCGCGGTGIPHDMFSTESPDDEPWDDARSGPPRQRGGSVAKLHSGDSVRGQDPGAGTPICMCIPGQFRYSVYVCLADAGTSHAAYAASLLVTLLIILSCITFSLETLPTYRYATEVLNEPFIVFDVIERVAIGVFTVEYLARLFTFSAVPREEDADSKLLLFEARMLERRALRPRGGGGSDDEDDDEDEDDGAVGGLSPVGAGPGNRPGLPELADARVPAAAGAGSEGGQGFEVKQRSKAQHTARVAEAARMAAGRASDVAEFKAKRSSLAGAGAWMRKQGGARAVQEARSGASKRVSLRLGQRPGHGDAVVASASGDDGTGDRRGAGRSGGALMPLRGSGGGDGARADSQQSAGSWVPGGDGAGVRSARARLGQHRDRTSGGTAARTPFASGGRLTGPASASARGGGARGGALAVEPQARRSEPGGDMTAASPTAPRRTSDGGLGGSGASAGALGAPAAAEAAGGAPAAADLAGRGVEVSPPATDRAASRPGGWADPVSTAASEGRQRQDGGAGGVGRLASERLAGPRAALLAGQSNPTASGSVPLGSFGGAAASNMAGSSFGSSCPAGQARPAGAGRDPPLVLRGSAEGARRDPHAAVQAAMGGAGRGGRGGEEDEEDATSAGSLSGRGPDTGRSALDAHLADERVEQVEHDDVDEDDEDDEERRRRRREGLTVVGRSDRGPRADAAARSRSSEKGSPGMRQLVAGRSGRNSLMSALEADGGDRLASLRAVAAPPAKAAAAPRTPARVSLGSGSGSQPDAPGPAPASSSFGAGDLAGKSGKKFSSWTASPSRQGSAQGMHQAMSSSEMGRLRSTRSRRRLVQEIGDPGSSGGGVARTARYIKPSKSVRMLSGVMQPGQITEFQRMRMTSQPAGGAAPYSSGSNEDATPTARPSLAGAGPSSGRERLVSGAAEGKDPSSPSLGAAGADGKTISHGHQRGRTGSETAAPLLGTTRRRGSAKVVPAGDTVPDDEDADSDGGAAGRRVGFAPDPPGVMRRGGRRAPARAGPCCRACCGSPEDVTTFQSTWSLDDQAVREEARQLDELRSRASVDSWRRRVAVELRRLWEFVVLPLNVVDLLAIVPFYIEAASSTSGGGLGLTVFRVLRLGRVFRIFKLGKSSATLQLMAKVMLASADALSIMIFFIAIGVVLFGALLWIAEGGEYDPDTGTFLRLNEFGTGRERTPFESIPATAWFIIVTLTTLGYGDQVPNSTLGRFIAALLALVGILVLALPVTILGANFAYFYSQDEKEKEEAERERFRAEEGFEDDLSDVYSQAGALDEIDAGPLGQPDQFDLERDDPVLAAVAIGLHDDVPRWEQRRAAFFPVQAGGYVPSLRSFVYNPYVKDDTFADGIAEALAAEVDERIADLRGDASTRRQRAMVRARAGREAEAEASGVAPPSDAGEEDHGEVVATDSRVVRRRSAAATARKRRRRSSAAGSIAGLMGLRTLGGLGQKGPSVVGQEPGADGTAVMGSPTGKQRRRLSATAVMTHGPGAAPAGDAEAGGGQAAGAGGGTADAAELVRAARTARRKAQRGAVGTGAAPGFRAAVNAAIIVGRAVRRPGRLQPAADGSGEGDTTAAETGIVSHAFSSSAPTAGPLAGARVVPAWEPAEGAGPRQRRPSHSRAITAVTAATARDRGRGSGAAADSSSEAGRGGKRDLYAKLTETRQRRDEWQKKGRFTARGGGGGGPDNSDDNASEDGGLQSVLGLQTGRGAVPPGTPKVGSGGGGGGGGGAGMGVSWQLRQVVKQVTRAVRSDGTAEAVSAVLREQCEMRDALDRTQEGLASALDEIRGLAAAMQARAATSPEPDGRHSRARPLPPPRASTAAPAPAAVGDVAQQLRRQLSASELRELLRTLKEDSTDE